MIPSCGQRGSILEITILDAPTNLGLTPTGVEGLGRALQADGLRERLRAKYAGRLEPLPYDNKRDPATRLLNPHGIRQFALQQAEAVAAILDRGGFPLVLGGDDSVLFGNLLTLRLRGRYGLVFLDAHTDFYLPEQSPTGQASDCDLALAIGRGPDLFADIDGARPLVRDEDVAVLGPRDASERQEFGSPDASATAMLVLELEQLRLMGMVQAAEEAMRHVLKEGVEGFWIHLDADVIDDAVNPAVDYRLPGGLGIEELGQVLRAIASSPGAVGMDVTIYNPALDPGGSAASAIIEAVVTGLRV
jgi:arginase